MDFRQPRRPGVLPDGVRARNASRARPGSRDSADASRASVAHGDEWAMVRSGRHTAADYLTLAAGYGREPSSGVLADVADRLAFIREYLTTTRAAPVRGVRAPMLRPVFDRVGCRRRLGLRRSAGAAGRRGRGARHNWRRRGYRRQSRAALDRSLAAGRRWIPHWAEPRAIAAEHGDTALYDALAAAARSGSPGERSLYLDATAGFRAPSVLARALRRALTPDVRAQDTALYLAPFFSNPVARPLAWAFVKSTGRRSRPR